LTDTSWSRLIDTEMGQYVADQMSNPSRTYHNIDHISRLYEMAKYWRLAYDPNLDCAILWHDVVYDALPDKELRSAELLMENAASMAHWFDGIDTKEVNKLILSTVSHQLHSEVDGLMIKLDLAELGKPKQCEENFWNIMQESINLYDVSPRDAAQGTLDFMRHFAITVSKNAVYGFWENQFVDDGDRYWSRVQAGVTQTQTMAGAVVQLYDRGHA